MTDARVDTADRAIRESRSGAKAVAAGTGGCLADGCTSGCGDVGGCADVGDGCSGCADLGDDGLAGCAGAIVVVVFLALVAALTYAAVVTAAWIVTIWGRALHRTSYEKADAEGMLLRHGPRSRVTPVPSAGRPSHRRSYALASSRGGYM